MPNAWVQHVKDWSARHNVSYGCAISKPECKASYHGKKPHRERETMGMEDTNVARRVGGVLNPVDTRLLREMKSTFSRASQMFYPSHLGPL